MLEADEPSFRLTGAEVKKLWKFSQTFIGVTTQQPPPMVFIAPIERGGIRYAGYAHMTKKRVQLSPDVLKEGILYTYITLVHEFLHFLLDWGGFGNCTYLEKNNLYKTVYCSHHCYMGRHGINAKIAKDILRTFFQDKLTSIEAHKELRRQSLLDQYYQQFCLAQGWIQN